MVYFNHNKLKGRIREKCGTEGNFCRDMSMAQATLTNKLNGASSFTQREIVKACQILDISPMNIPVYFFTLRV